MDIVTYRAVIAANNKQNKTKKIIIIINKIENRKHPRGHSGKKRGGGETNIKRNKGIRNKLKNKHM